MKKYLFILVFLVASTCLFSQKPLIKFYLTNKDFKTYNLNELQSIQFLNKSESLQLEVCSNNGSYYYPAKVIDSIAFVTTSDKISALNVIIDGTDRIHELPSIDSILIYYTKFTSITICNQVWMNRNLDVDHYRNGDSIPEVTDPTAWSTLKTGAWCYYNNDPAMGAMYGKLYNWYAVNDPRGLAPIGWHVATDEEWKELEMCLGMSRSDADNSGYRGTSEGGKLKTTGTIQDGDGIWQSPNKGATNEIGFSGLPAGLRIYNGTFGKIDSSAAWWNSTNNTDAYSWYRGLNSGNSYILRNYGNNNYGFSIRCVRPSPTLPLKINSISPNSGFMRDIVILTGSGFGESKGTSFVSFIGAIARDILSWSETEINLLVPKGAKTGKVSVTVNGVKSNDVDFTVKSSPADDTVIICNQIWMTKNLDVDHYRNGDSIPEVKDAKVWSNLKTGAWCYYNNNPAMGAIYGKLYNWYAVNDSRGLAPEGWHIPSDAEWKDLATCLGEDSLTGGKLKCTGNNKNGDGLWYTPNTGATNEVGFSALPGGNRYINGLFSSNGYFANWYSSTEVDNITAWDWTLGYDVASLSRSFDEKTNSFSVRCVKPTPAIPSKINNITPNTGFMRDKIILKGIGFGDLMDASFVSFSGAKVMEILNWSDTQIYLRVPKGAKTGKVSITVNGVKSNEVDFIVKSTPADDTVKICNQIWMTKNLNVDHYRNGDSIPEVTDPIEWSNLKTGAWCYYNNDPAMGAIYGKLYNWYAVNDPRGLAPFGWYVPSDSEFKELELCIGMSQTDIDIKGWRGIFEAQKLKETGTLEDGDGLWLSTNKGATNETGFSALPAGYRDYNGSFVLIGVNTYWWSSNDYDSIFAWIRGLYNKDDKVNRDGSNQGYGYSVRCFRPSPILPLKINNISPNSGFMRDSVIITGSGFGASEGISFVTFIGAIAKDISSWSDTLIKLQVPKGSKTGKVSVTVNGVKSNEVDFTVKSSQADDTIKIYNKIWMTKNLNVDHYSNGDSIPEVRDAKVWSNIKTGAWCYYNNNPAMGSIYGKLYNWYAVNDSRGLAPAGWHIPTDSEWKELEIYLGMSKLEADYPDYRGTTEGGKIKSTGTIEDGNGLWKNPNVGSTNEVGFSGLPGGCRLIDGSFGGESTNAYFYSTTLYRALSHDLTSVFSHDPEKDYGFSVRCISSSPAIPMRINNISPNSGFMRENIILTGSGFGNSKSTRVLSFLGANANDILSWSDTMIVSKVPKGAKTGKVFLIEYGVKSNDVDFAVKSSPEDDTVEICNQIWMTKNLNVDHFRNGDSIPEVTDPEVWSKLKTGAWCYFKNDTALGSIYGKLYNWYAVNDPRGLAPVGWRIANQGDWVELTECLDGSNITGGKLKITGTLQSGDGLWNDPNIGATNEIGFSGLPAGLRYQDGYFHEMNNYTSWWTSTSHSTIFAWFRFLNLSSMNIGVDMYDKRNGFSVRCVKE